MTEVGVVLPLPLREGGRAVPDVAHADGAVLPLPLREGGRGRGRSVQ